MPWDYLRVSTGRIFNPFTIFYRYMGEYFLDSLRKPKAVKRNKNLHKPSKRLKQSRGIRDSFDQKGRMNSTPLFVSFRFEPFLVLLSGQTLVLNLWSFWVSIFAQSLSEGVELNFYIFASRGITASLSFPLNAWMANVPLFSN